MNRERGLRGSERALLRRDMRRVRENSRLDDDMLDTLGDESMASKAKGTFYTQTKVECTLFGPHLNQSRMCSFPAAGQAGEGAAEDAQLESRDEGRAWW